MAGFLSYGSAKALSYRHDFQQDIDRLYQREAYRSQVEAEKAKKAQYYAQLMKEGTAVAPYNTHRLEEFYDGLNDEVAKFMTKYGPAIDTDIGLQQQLMRITDKYLNNDIIREDVQVQQEFARLKDAYNNQKLKGSQYEAEMERYSNYIENGGDPYIFSNLLVPEYSDIVKAANDAIEGELKTVVRDHALYDTLVVSDQKYRQRAITDMSDPDIATVINKRFETSNEQFPNLYKNPYDMYIQSMRIGEQTKDIWRGWDPLWQTSEEEKIKAQYDLANTYPHFTQTIAPKFQNGSTIQGNANFLAFTRFGNVGKTWDLGDGQMVKIRNKDGVFEEVFLKGQLKATNGHEMIVTDGGAFVRVDVETVVNQAERTGEPTKIYYDDDKKLSKREFDERFNDLDERQRQKVLNGEKIKGLQIRTQQPDTNADYYRNAGFNEKAIADPGLAALSEINGQRVSYPVYSKDIWIEADFTTETLTAYESAVGTKDQASKLKPLLETAEVVRDQTIQGNWQFATEVLGDTYGGKWAPVEDNPVYYSKIGTGYKYNIMTGQIHNPDDIKAAATRLAKERGGEWIPHPEDNSILYNKDNPSQAYDTKTGRMAG